MYIVIFDRKAYQISGKLFADIAAYIDDRYVDCLLYTSPTAFSHTCKQIYEIVIDCSLSICVGNPDYRVADLKHLSLIHI